MHEPSLASLLTSRRVVVCAGCGGVGKTSVAAALSVAGARLGLSVLALTIDPAKRLAESLGVRAESSERQYIEPELLAQLGVDNGQVSVLVLDPAQTLLEVVARLAPNLGARQRIVEHPLFRHLVDDLAGANEYMAMEKLLSVLADDDYDLLILDTPPTRHALDFLSAPERLTDAIDSPLMRAFSEAASTTRRLSFDFVARGVASMIRNLGRFTGTGMLQELATLIAELNAIFGGFRERARRVAEAFRGPQFAYFVVVRPEELALQDGLFFIQALEKRGMTASALVVNRVRQRLASSELLAGLREIELRTGPKTLTEIAAALEEHQSAAAVEATQLAALQRFPKGLCRVELPALSRGVAGLADLSQLASCLVAAGHEAEQVTADG